MTHFVVDSDKIFLRALDTETLEVLELEGLYLAPVKGKYWKPLASIKLTRGREGALKIMSPNETHDQVEISGSMLESLIKDLNFSQLIVNREGLCYLPTPGDTLSTLGLEYYRLFDLFDWPKYGVKMPSSLSTQWARRLIIEGRPYVIPPTNDPPPNNNLQYESHFCGGQGDSEVGILSKKVDFEVPANSFLENKEMEDNYSEKLHEMVAKFRYTLLKYPKEKLKVHTSGTYQMTGEPSPGCNLYPVSAYFTPEIESEIPDVVVMSGIDYDREHWFVCAVSQTKYDIWSSYKWVLIYYDGKEVIPEDSNSAPFPTEEFKLQFFPKGFWVYNVLRDIGGEDFVGFPRWGILYNMKEGSFVTRL